MAINKKDFIEIEFTGKVKNGEIFDSNIKSDLEKTKIPSANAKPLIISIGEGMFLKAIDDFLVGKEIGKDYEIELSPEKAFGIRMPNLVKIIPIKLFHENQLNPQVGVVFNFDGQMAKIISVSGGRVITDFNNPLAGKDVTYNIKILRKVDDLHSQAKALVDFFFRRELKFEIKETKLILEVEKQFSKFAELFSEKFKDILGLNLEVIETENKEKKHNHEHTEGQEHNHEHNHEHSHEEEAEEIKN